MAAQHPSGFLVGHLAVCEKVGGGRVLGGEEVGGSAAEKSEFFVFDAQGFQHFSEFEGFGRDGGDGAVEFGGGCGGDEVVQGADSFCDGVGGGDEIGILGAEEGVEGEEGGAHYVPVEVLGFEGEVDGVA